MKKRLLFVLLLLFSVVLVACIDDEVKFTVTFNSNGGTNVESIEVDDGELAPRPTDPTRDGFIFEGWFKEQTHTNEWKWAEDKVTADITLYAKWKEDTSGQVGEKVEVTFDFNYSGSAAPSVVEIDKGAKVTNAPALPTRVDFEFVGWSTSRTELVEFDLDAVVNADVTLYAIWESTRDVHTVTVNFGYDDKTETHEIIDGELLEITDPTRDGYLFLGWLKGEDPFSLETPITEDVTIVANWILDDSGLEGEPITNATQLLELFRTGGSGSYYLAIDIDMSDVEFEGSLGSGDNAVTFTGVLDGNGKRINNFDVVAPGNKTAAMFGVLDGATIRNLIIMRSSIYVPGEAAGFVAAYVRGKTTFEDLTFINVTTDSTGNYAGLLYADNQNNESTEPVTIKNIVVVNDNDHEIKAGRYVGALVGHLRHQQLVNIENVYIKSNVKVESNSTAAALVGRIQHADVVLNINNVYFEGEVFATNYVGGLVGQADTSAKIDIKNVLINSALVHSSGSTADLLIGRRGELDLTTENVYYDSVEVFRNDDTIVPVNSEEATEVKITETWFAASTLNKDFFAFDEGKIIHKVDLGPKEPERLTISRSSYNDLFIKGVDLDLDLDNLLVSVAFSDGSTTLMELSELSIDKSSFDKDTVGKYTITITYENLEGSIEINVVEVTKIVVHTYDTDSLFVKDNVDVSKIVVHAILGDGSHIILDNEELEIVYVAETVGEQNVKVTYKEEFDVEFPITIVENVLVATDGLVEVVVDHGLTGVSGATDEGVVHVKTVKEAINLIEKSSLSEDTIKKIYVKDGTYFEKIRIATPNVHLVGESQEDTIIDYDRASGNVKPQGGEWGTQGSATVTISSAARGFIAHNLTFSNSFDYYGSTVGNKQAVALVNEADRALFYKVSFLGLQDTLYAKNGRQWYLDVYVEGIVDYIFGNGGPAFFENSVIHTLKREDTSANAVITANQGLGSSASEVIKYGYVFYNNILTAGEGTLDGSVDLGRPWRQDSAVAFIDNTFGSFISEAGWVEMSGNKPEDANYFEFGNKVGENDYQSTIGTPLTAEDAAVYRNKDVIFATTNGDVTFVGEWDYLASLAMVAPELFVTVTFDADGELTKVLLPKGEKAEVITEPIKAGHTFDGWFIGEDEFNFETGLVEDITLTAKFTPIASEDLVTVTFMVGEDVYQVVDVEKDGLVIEVEKPSVDGFIFKGWLLDGEPFNFDTPITEDIVLIADLEEFNYVPVGTPISTVEEFMDFLSKSSGEYYLADDIDFTGFDPLTEDEKKTFTGTLDGNFKTISNLTRTTERGGLFRSIKGATFKNITFDNVTMVGTNRAGMIAGEAPKDDNVSTFENIVIINSTINGAANNGVGAIVGMGQSNLVINNIKVINTNLSNTAQAAGAVIGQIDGAYNISISDIFIQSVDIEAKSRVGSIYGESKNGAVITISNVVAVNTNIKATESNVAVVAGYHNVDGIGSVSNVFYNGTIEGTSKVAHVVAEKVLESYESVYIANTTITGTLNGTTLTEDSILESIPSEAWWSENLPSITINNLWEFDSTLNVYKLK